MRMSRAGLCVLASASLMLGSAVAQILAMPPAPVDPRRQTPLLADETQVFGFIAATLHLGSADDSELIHRLETSSSVDHLHDYRGEAIFAVKPELLDAEGASHVRAPDGNYPFFVFRQSEHGWLLLGQMQGRGYDWSTLTRHLIFNMSVARPHGVASVVRYEVNSAYLVNLTELARSERRDEKIIPTWKTAF